MQKDPTTRPVDRCLGPRFGVEESFGDDTLVYLRWHFGSDKAASRRRVLGVSRVQFASDGLVSGHRDYRDPASRLYEKLPLWGQLLRSLHNRLAAPHSGDRDTNTPLFCYLK